ncbi:kynureninase, putative [Talaromyces stipitatus ATCC 10500]|uniref:Kynureninase n=1 Tax=Talaromyces stipitatus (strain ATCC 10500 / CBS 375.48 / QM 6759 / NRRL 1006) TaxID=441959 RepID=B8MKT0_TALSN|nr:kynureninase, putative [Talaromyces stipitatus ATCC 10500]EED14929.1 kynureninase, putative [Talaromyces stipitatus ATCC 10500]
MAPSLIAPVSPSSEETIHRMEATKFIPTSYPSNAQTREYAESLDQADTLRSFRDKFIIPSKANLKATKLAKPGLSADESIYFCGNSLGLQPRATSAYIQAQLDTWSSIGVNGHFRDLEDSPLKSWQLLAEQAAGDMALIVGASPEEIAAMGTLTANLHLLLASFYKPTESKHKILLDWKAFPSDHYAIESQIAWHGRKPSESMVLIGPDEGEYIISTEKILSIIDEHASKTALLLLPGIQYYSGQLFDIPTITKHAQARGIIVGWDLAHVYANVDVKLHEWNVDFAAWCTYKYGNAGPGAIGGAFVHERHGTVDYSQGEDKPVFRHRLTGWYGGDRSVRFKMDNKFKPIPGAGGFQVSNPSAIDLAALCSSLSVFNETSIAQLRAKSLRLTHYLEYLLLAGTTDETRKFRIITPSDPNARGAQLSLLLNPGLLDKVAQRLEDAGIICDKRQPDVVRVAPAPLYNTFTEVWTFVNELKTAIA